MIICIKSGTLLGNILGGIANFCGETVFVMYQLMPNRYTSKIIFFTLKSSFEYEIMKIFHDFMEATINLFEPVRISFFLKFLI